MTADNHPELVQQLEKLKAIADKLNDNKVGSLSCVSQSCKKNFHGVSDQVQHKPGCTATDDG